tara:strand:+ start:611 stop:826 length:216 start_codon:yes stop_codon:yes gene_type:complete
VPWKQGTFFIYSKETKMTYWDYEIAMTENGIEFDKEITLQTLKKYHDFNEGDEFLLVVLNGKVCLIKKNEE